MLALIHWHHAYELFEQLRETKQNIVTSFSIYWGRGAYIMHAHKGTSVEDAVTVKGRGLGRVQHGNADMSNMHGMSVRLTLANSGSAQG